MNIMKMKYNILRQKNSVSTSKEKICQMFLIMIYAPTVSII